MMGAGGERGREVPSEEDDESVEEDDDEYDI